jgi:hypothetical protein
MKSKSNKIPSFTPTETIEELLDDLEQTTEDMDSDGFHARYLVDKIIRRTDELDFLSDPRKEEVEGQYRLMKRMQRLRSHPKLRTLFEKH